MKKSLLFYSFWLFVIGSFVSCTSKTSSPALITQVQKSDSLKIAAWDKLFSKPGAQASTSARIPNKSFPVKHSLAQGCIDNYEDIYNTHINDAAIKNAHTTGVDFASSELSTWLFFASQNITYNEIRVCFGVYTHEYALAYPTAKEGRLTVFLWPYQNAVPSTYSNSGTLGSGNGTTLAMQKDSLADPFNLGNVYP